MNEQEQTRATQALPSQCSNPACRTVFTAPVQNCLTCGALLKGKLLSERFRIESLMGRGGMGAVYQATDLALGRAVAVKVLAPSAGTAGDAPQELRARFFREARLAAQLDHPNIVPVLHFDIDGPLAYLVMPLLTGGTLARRVRPRNPNDPVIVAGWLRQIAAALDYGHHRPQPIVHRDVKPSNLLFHEDGRLCLADFGIARVVAGSESGEAHLTRTGMVLGSLSYMAPEQINGRAVPASDQYSTGVMLYEALTGALPFDAADNYGVIIQHVNATPPLPSEQVTSLPRAVDTVVARALAKQPEDRYPTVGALAEAFEVALANSSTAQAPLPSQQFATIPQPPRSAFPSEIVHGQTAAFPGDLGGEHPTEAATMQRPSLGWGPVGLPPQTPPTPPKRRRWWIPVLVAVLAVLLVCVVGLAGLGALGNAAKNNQAAQTATTTAQTPSAPATPTQAQRYENLLLAAEQHPPIYQDPLTSKGHWVVTAPGRFASDGLNLPTHEGLGRFAEDQTLTAANVGQPVPLSDIEVSVKFTGANVNYGLIFPAAKEPYLALVLGTQGYYGVAYLYNDNNRDTISGLSADARLTLAAGQVYHLQVLVQQNQFVLFIEKQFIAALPISEAFPAAALLGLFTNSPKNTPEANVVFSNLRMYALPPASL